MATYPPIGKIVEARFGDLAFRLAFKDGRTMSFAGVSGPAKGVSDTVQYTAIEVGRGASMVYWHEPRLGSNVVHVQDWNSGVVFTNISARDGTFTHYKGSIRILS